MVKNFPVRDAKDLEGLEPGTLIDFTLVVDKDCRLCRRHSCPSIPEHGSGTDGCSSTESTRWSRRLGSDATKKLEIGERVPDFSLIDQSGQSVSLSSFTGKVVGITFMYTHCPLPNYCFRLSNNFAVVRKRFPDRLGRDLILLNISFDPVHDQPEVLAQYARNWNAAGRSRLVFLNRPGARGPKSLS